MGAATFPSAQPAVHITLDLPIPPSVNRTRKIDWAGLRALKEFYLRTDLHLTAYGPRPPPVRLIKGAYEVLIQVPESSGYDLDNHVKTLIDYLVSREFVTDDRARYLRRLVVQWIDPEICPLCRVTITATGA